MYQKSNNQFTKKILFLDIETVSCTESYEALPEAMRLLWDKKSYALHARSTEQVDPACSFFNEAAIYAEFGKVIVIALGYFTNNEKGETELRIKGLQSHNEKELLENFKSILEQFTEQHLQLCAHNGKEFDFPYLCRRMIINNIAIPGVLNMGGKKPWEVPHLDTMEMWKFGDRKSFTSLHLMATIFGIVSSKEIMEGSEVNSYYYTKNDMETITKYCMQDVAVLAQVFCKLNGLPILSPEHIILT
ncbi:3'-5' exonuclease [Cardinium endosymbiont of Culicoides punctatus]|uniref:3'-5' exonuclease n=1 Tax=Cardinium endosymbiont of Culicoides punctatus TaxID=2304601 RepID=UPI00105891F3|nr:3'-5' exonuclease [Cardinium endosymbiont of Culicoides punctatus]TDG95275.1 hypothetical protein CCPUN_05280 [Cardinium endosymbiont of Culicoides punctatus]